MQTRNKFLLFGGFFLALGASLAQYLSMTELQAQPYPSGLINPGTVGDAAMYVAPRIIGPGTNTAVTTTVYNFSVSGKATFNQFLVVSNGVQTASIAWAGPTNTLPLNSWRQHYTTFTPISVTGFTQKSTTNVQPFTLCILNSASTNVTFLFAAGVADLNYVTSYTITNGTELIWAGEYDPYLTRSNALGRIAP